MNRNKFLTVSSSLIAGFTLSKFSMASKFLNFLPFTDKMMPVLFMGHGNPMNAILDNNFTQSWREIAENIPKPNAILCMSAHWETKGTKVLAVNKPKLIYDMYGFPPELYEVKYPCQGAPELAENVVSMVNKTTIDKDYDWGLDHGSWSILTKMYPEADIPCFQLSLDRSRDLQYHYDLAAQLKDLRQKGVLIIGSGNIVHNLQYAKFGDVKPYDWAIEFDELIKKLIVDKDHRSIINYQKFGSAALLSVNSAEHYIPLIYTLALQNEKDEITFFNEQIAFGSGSMRCVKIG